MQPDPRDKAYLWDMLDAAQAIAEFVEGKTYADYLANRMLRGAVEHHYELEFWLAQVPDVATRRQVLVHARAEAEVVAAGVEVDLQAEICRQAERREQGSVGAGLPPDEPVE